MIIHNFILLQTASTECYSCFSTSFWSIDVIIELILSSSNPLDFQKYIITIQTPATLLKYLYIG